jgi:hypothetical protein
MTDARGLGGIDEVDLMGLSVDWRPPGRGDPTLARLVAELADDREGIGAKIQAANQTAFKRLISAEPILVDLRPAGDTLAHMTPTTITLGENPNYTLPALDFRGAPTGIDVCRVVERNIAPVHCRAIAC